MPDKDIRDRFRARKSGDNSRDDAPDEIFVDADDDAILELDGVEDPTPVNGISATRSSTASKVDERTMAPTRREPFRSFQRRSMESLRSSASASPETPLHKAATQTAEKDSVAIPEKEPEAPLIAIEPEEPSMMESVTDAGLLAESVEPAAEPAEMVSDIEALPSTEPASAAANAVVCEASADPVAAEEVLAPAEVAGAATEGIPPNSATSEVTPAPVADLALDCLPLRTPIPRGERTWVDDFQRFKDVSERLVRVGNWHDLAATTGYALLHAPYATGMTRNAMLQDLARIYRDRLQDSVRAEQAFAALVREDPDHSEALAYLSEAYEKRGEWKPLFSLFCAAVEASWDPRERLAWTRRAADVAIKRQENNDLAIEAWERLWRLGDAQEEASRELSRYYRATERWDKLAEFLQQRADRLEGAASIVVYRELAEVLLSGLCNPEAAGRVLERIVEINPQDPIATLQLARVYAQQGNWEALARVGRQSLAGHESSNSGLDLQHLVADALWQAERFDMAVETYDRILVIAPLDAISLARKRDYLTQSQRYDALLDFLESQAKQTVETDKRSEILLQAAQLAETKLDNLHRASALWEVHLKLRPDHAPSHEALCRIYEKLGDADGLALALEGLLKQTRPPQTRIGLLRRLGSHFSKNLKDDQAAERCWREILSLDPNDRAVRDELIHLHQRRGEWEALNHSLMRQIWMTDDPVRLKELCRLAAENVEQNLDDPLRTIEAWRRVLDFEPTHPQAFLSLTRNYQRLDDRQSLIATLEYQIRSAQQPAERIELALKIAELWLREHSPRAAAASYERVLCWQPTHPLALDALICLYKEQGQPGKAAGVIEYAATLPMTAAERIALLHRRLELLPDSDHRGRFFLLRRILRLTEGDMGIVAQMRTEAQSLPELWPELIAVQGHFVCRQATNADRQSMLRELATLYEAQVQDPHRAYLALQSTLLTSENVAAVLPDLRRLANSTQRVEDLLCVLDRLTTPEYDLPSRKQHLRERALLCEQNLQAPLRAFHEYQRLLDLDPNDEQPLSELERLAEQHGLWQPFDAILREIADRCAERQKRHELLARLERIAQEKLADPALAFDRQVERFRHLPQDSELRQALMANAASLDGWTWLLPMLEAQVRSSMEATTPADLLAIAGLYKEKAQDPEQTFLLANEAFLTDPTTGDLPAQLEILAAQVNGFSRLAMTYRSAATLAKDHEQTIELLRRVATLYEVQIKEPARAIDIHRLLLHLKKDEIRSLAVMIDWHREHQEWRDLRDRLQQWVVHSHDALSKIDRLLEIARLSQTTLNEPESALDAYGQILQIDPEHGEARQGLAQLESAMTEPGMRTRWLLMQVKLAPPEQATRLRLEVAQTQEQVLGDIDGAAATLESLLADSGPEGPAIAPLIRLLRDHERWTALVALLLRQAEQLSSTEQQFACLDEALEIGRQYLGDQEPQLREQLYRAVLLRRPTDAAVRIRLAQLLRQAGRWSDLVQLQTESLDHVGNERARIDTLYDLARLKAANLGRMEEAESDWQQILASSQNEQGALLALARCALQRGDLERYLELRQRQAELLPPRESAHVLCHLAEVCDENPALAPRMLALYRKARTVDPDNMPAMEALKGIGRRLKTLRPAAALLPEKGEREMAVAQRSARLRELGDQAIEQDLPRAIDWYRRAVAVDPDDAQAWQTLAQALRKAGDATAAYAAMQARLRAIQRMTPMASDGLATEAQWLHDLALYAQAAQQTERQLDLLQQAYALMPQYPPAAVAMAQLRLMSDDLEGACDLLDRLLVQQRQELTEAQHINVRLQRGQILRRMGRNEEALEDFRQILQIRPLHAEALSAMGELHTEAGRYAGALEFQVRALTVMQDPLDRARLLHRIGATWEDKLQAAEEAGACYELARAEGLVDRDLLHRTLRHYQRTGRQAECLELLDALLPNADDPDELATLWLLRGQIYAAQSGQEQQAVSAFDMALSYDPNRQAARDGLIQVLERSGDWDQLVQVLEATIDQGTVDQRAVALLRMAKICEEQLGDPQRSEQYLRESIRVQPTRAALDRLYTIYSADPSRRCEMREVLGLLTQFGPPWFDRCVALAQMLESDQRRWAWCLVSPLQGVSRPPAETKTLIQDLRIEFEKASILAPSDEDYHLLIEPDPFEGLGLVLMELEAAVGSLGPTSLEALGGGGVTAVGESSSVGKTFRLLAQLIGQTDVVLCRAADLPEAVRIIATPSAPSIVFRADILQQAVKAEALFLFAYALELVRPGNRIVAGLPEADRSQLIAALWSAMGLAQNVSPAAERMATKIRAAVDGPTLAAWADQLAALRDRDHQELGRALWPLLCRNALRSGLLAGADLRQAFRAVTRLSDDVAKMKVVGTVADLDEIIGASPVLRELVIFAASPAFGQLMRTAQAVEER